MKIAELHGLIAEFQTPEEVVKATRAAYERGYRKMDAYTPYAVEGLAEALGMRRTGVPFLTLISGLTGGVIGYAMQLYSASVAYPLNVGGRPFHSWPSFVPITFELTILFAAIGAVLGMLLLNGLPRPHHAVFNTPFFEARNQSHFYLCIEAADDLFVRDDAADFLLEQHPAHIWEVVA